MKISVNKMKGLQLEKVYNPITLVTNTGEHLSVCMRNSGFELFYQGIPIHLKEGKIIPIEVLSGRASGRTTRQVDAAVQELFTKGAVYWQDHAATPGNRANDHGFKILLERLYYEHGLNKEKLNVNKKKFWITFKEK